MLTTSVCIVSCLIWREVNNVFSYVSAFFFLWDPKHCIIYINSALREAEEKDKKLRERTKEAARRTEEIKEMTTKYEAEKIARFEQLALIKNEFCSQVRKIKI